MKLKIVNQYETQFDKNNGIKAVLAIYLIEIAIFITMIKKYYFPRDQYDNNISCR